MPLKTNAETTAYNAWFRGKVQEALDDPRPPIPHDEVEAYFAKRRAAASMSMKAQKQQQQEPYGG